MGTHTWGHTHFFAPHDRGAWQSHFMEKGYCILKGVLPPEALASAQRGCEALVDELVARLVASGKLDPAATADSAPFDQRLIEVCRSCPGELPNLFRAELHRAEFYPLLCDPTVLDICSALMPDSEAMRIYPNYSCRPKTPSPLHVVTWHQDAGLRADGGPAHTPVAERLENFGIGKVVNCWAPLVPARAENGAMKFIPGSHAEGILEHCLVSTYSGGKAGASGQSLPDSIEDFDKENCVKPVGSYMTAVNAADMARLEAGAIDVECDPGDLILFNNILLHRGGENSSDRIRWSFDWRFQDAAKSTCRPDQGHIVWGPGAVSSGEWPELALC